ncbi:MAG TPA: CRISPR-associated endonuclease Cas2 [Chloroflexi bacterium]|nr:CRISPR-associated endonuclease Cas2 [Chloroflexota bacterium]
MSNQYTCYVVAYDIPDDRRRSRVARVLEGHGERVQYSLFECRLTGKQFTALWKELGKEIMPREDSLRAYRLCPVCARWVKTVGRAVETSEIPEVYIA